jgi:Fe-S cluster assembly protein SufD
MASTDTHLELFEQQERHRAHEPSWLRATRRAAIAAFERQGFPTTRHEEWRFTNVAPITSSVFSRPLPSAVAREETARFLVPGIAGPTLVFVDGRPAPVFWTPGATPGVRLTTLADVIARDPGSLEPHLGRHVRFDDRPFAALNTALFEDGAVVFVEDGRVVDQPIQLLFLSTGGPVPTSSNPRVLVVAGNHSQSRVIETYAGIRGPRGFTNAVTEVVVGRHAIVDHYRLQRESDAAFHIGHTQIQIGRSGTAASHSISLGALIARHDAVAVLAEEGADCTLNGLYLADGVRLVDNHTDIDHATPHGTSHQIYKGILGGRAHGVFNGRITVRPDAQKTDAKQTNKTLLLSDDAQVNTKPQLEIFANDVKCTHGATVGQLSDDALFYLRARGIGLDEARSLLVRAFATDVTAKMGLAPVRDEIDRLLTAMLPGAVREEVPA